eukprot:2000502-Prymnesium_polylepis.1
MVTIRRMRIKSSIGQKLCACSEVQLVLSALPRSPSLPVSAPPLSLFAPVPLRPLVAPVPLRPVSAPVPLPPLAAPVPLRPLAAP